MDEADAAPLGELDELEQAASNGPATAAMPPAASSRRLLMPVPLMPVPVIPAPARAEFLVVAIETEVPLSLLC